VTLFTPNLSTRRKISRQKLILFIAFNFRDLQEEDITSKKYFPKKKQAPFLERCIFLNLWILMLADWSLFWTQIEHLKFIQASEGQPLNSFLILQPLSVLTSAEWSKVNKLKHLNFYRLLCNHWSCSHESFPYSWEAVNQPLINFFFCPVEILFYWAF